jgi:hypothetical protein
MRPQSESCMVTGVWRLYDVDTLRLGRITKTSDPHRSRPQSRIASKSFSRRMPAQSLGSGGGAWILATAILQASGIGTSARQVVAKTDTGDTSAHGPPGPGPPGWNLLWRDDFNGAQGSPPSELWWTARDNMTHGCVDSLSCIHLNLMH